MNKQITIEASKLRDAYQNGDKKTKAVPEGLYGKEALLPNDEELWETVKERLLRNEQPNRSDVEAAVAYVEKLRARAKTSENRVEPWAIKNDAGDIIGVGVPIINKAFYFADVPEGDKEMTWDDAVAFAKKRGRTLASKAELMLCYYFKAAINAIAEEAGVEGFLDDWVWSSTEYNTYTAWTVNFNNGLVGTFGKYYTLYVVRPVAAL